MTEVDAGLVRRKLAAIAPNLEDLAAVERWSLAQETITPASWRRGGED